MCGAVLVLCAMSSPRDMLFQILHRAGFVVCSSVLGMLSSAISAFERAYYHLPTRPEWRERAPGLSLRNLGFGAESARCVLVEFLLHFGACKSAAYSGLVSSSGAGAASWSEPSASAPPALLSAGSGAVAD